MPAAGANNWGGRQAPPSEAGSDAEDSGAFGVSFGTSGFHGRNHAHFGVSCVLLTAPTPHEGRDKCGPECTSAKLLGRAELAAQGGP